MTITLDIIFWLFLFIIVFTAVCIGWRFNDIEKKIEIIDIKVNKIQEDIENITEELLYLEHKIDSILDQTDTILKYEFNKESDKQL